MREYGVLVPFLAPIEVASQALSHQKSVLYPSACYLID
jgi:hypothetical protein